MAFRKELDRKMGFYLFLGFLVFSNLGGFNGVSLRMVFLETLEDYILFSTIVLGFWSGRFCFVGTIFNEGVYEISVKGNKNLF